VVGLGLYCRWVGVESQLTLTTLVQHYMPFQLVKGQNSLFQGLVDLRLNTQLSESFTDSAVIAAPEENSEESVASAVDAALLPDIS
jgi:hypothetical protein